MTTSEKQLLRAIRRVLKTEESRQKWRLKDDERITFEKCWFDMVHLAATRMVTGSSEHRDSQWRHVNFKRASAEEFVDGAHYNKGDELFGRK